MATGAGYERRANETYSWEGLKRGAAPFIVLQHTIAGRGELDFEGVHHALTAGDTMLLSFPHPHRYWLAQQRSWEYFWIGFNGRDALRIARAVIDTKGPVLRLPDESIDRLAAACLAFVSRDMPLGETSAEAYAAMMALHDGVFGDTSSTSVETPAPIQRAQAFVEQNLAGNLGVERLARAAQLSRAHFVRLFAASVGMAPSAYVFEKRMQRAERLLLATDATIAEVAANCGFAEGNYFAKAFRRANGVSPSEFREAGSGVLRIGG
jgi:AraC-like DNA-binding protein